MQSAPAKLAPDFVTVIPPSPLLPVPTEWWLVRFCVCRTPSAFPPRGGDDSEGRKHEESPYIAYLKNYKSGSKKSHSSKDTKHAYREYDHSGDEDSGYDGYPGGYRRNGPPEDRHYYPMDMEARVETVNKGPTSSKGLWAYGWSSSRSYGGAEHRKYVAKHAKHSKYHSA